MTESVWSAPLNPGDRGAAYTNSVNVALTQWDLTLDFQFATPAPGSPSGRSLEGSNVPIASERVARLVMSPTHAKVLSEALTGAVAEWERRFGPLPDTSVLLPGGLQAAGNPQPGPDPTGAAAGPP